MLDRAQIKKMAKQQIRGNQGIYFLCILVGGFISAFTSMFIVGIFIAPAISFGYTIMALKMSHNGKIQFGDLFHGFSYYGKVLWLSIITAVFTILWSMLFYIPGIIKAYSYSFAPYILADHPEMTARQALRESKRLTSGYKGQLFVLDLSYIGWMLLAALTFGLLYIWIIPYWETAKADYYIEICKVKGGFAAGNAQQTSYNAQQPYNSQQENYGVQPPYNTHQANYNAQPPQNMQPNNVQAPYNHIPQKNPIDFQNQFEEEQLTTPIYSDKDINKEVQEKSAGIECLSGEYQGGIFPISEGEELIIGRNSTMCNVVFSLSNKALSQKHVAVGYNSRNDMYIVTDFSINGTFANGQRLKKNEPVQLKSGTVLSLATDRVEFLLK